MSIPTYLQLKPGELIGTRQKNTGEVTRAINRLYAEMHPHLVFGTYKKNI